MNSTTTRVRVGLALTAIALAAATACGTEQAGGNLGSNVDVGSGTQQGQRYASPDSLDKPTKPAPNYGGSVPLDSKPELDTQVHRNIPR